MTEFDLGWVVGILEGEGCFTFSNTKRERPTPRISVGMTDYDTIMRLYLITEVGHIRVEKRELPQQDIWRWTIDKRTDIRNFLEQITPYMGERRQQRIKDLIPLLPFAKDVRNV